MLRTSFLLLLLLLLPTCIRMPPPPRHQSPCIYYYHRYFRVYHRYYFYYYFATATATTATSAATSTTNLKTAALAFKTGKAPAFVSTCGRKRSQSDILTISWNEMTSLTSTQPIRCLSRQTANSRNCTCRAVPFIRAQPLV